MADEKKSIQFGVNIDDVQELNLTDEQIESIKNEIVASVARKVKEYKGGGEHKVFDTLYGFASFSRYDK